MRDFGSVLGDRVLKKQKRKVGPAGTTKRINSLKERISLRAQQFQLLVYIARMDDRRNFLKKKLGDKSWEVRVFFLLENLTSMISRVELQVFITPLDMLSLECVD